MSFPDRLIPFLLTLAVAVAAGLPIHSAHASDDVCVDENSEEGPIHEGKGQVLCGRAQAATRASSAEIVAAAAEAAADTDVIHYFLDVEVVPLFTGPDITDVQIEGVSTIDFEPTVDGLTTFTVDLRSNLTVNSVTGDVTSWSRIGHTIEITLDQAYDTGQSVQVAVDYEGIPEDAGLGTFKWWLRNGELVVATLAEPDFGHYWWPLKDELDDKVTMEMHVTVPSGMVVGSNGLEVGTESLSGGRVKFKWQETYPMIPYLASIAATSYERYDLQYDYDDGGTPASMPVVCYVYPDHWDSGAGQPTSAVKNGCDELLDMLETFEGLFGRYPWIDEKYGVAETGGAGGLQLNMEHQTLSSMYQLSFYTDVMAHELGHQWWGDDVTCETWYDIWLNEAFASYSEPLFQEFGPDGGIDDFWSQVNYLRPASENVKVYRTDISNPDAIFHYDSVYRKGSWVLHMLRRTIGDAAFFQFLSDYRAAFTADSATTAEMTAVLSSSFGEDLSWFIDQWVMNSGAPDYEWNWETRVVDGQHFVNLRIVQTQDGQGYGLLEMPIEIRVTTAGGTTVHRVWNDDWEEYYTLAVDGVAIDVEFDEDGGVSNRNWVLFDSRAIDATAIAAPPALLSMSVEDGENSRTAIRLRFSEEIGDFDLSDFALEGAIHGARNAVSVNYDAPTQTAVIEFSDLPADDYTFSVFDAGVTANGKLLDGEADTAAWWDAQVLPTGDGQSGGDAVFRFDTGPIQVPSADWPLRGILAAGLAAAALHRLRR